MTEEYNVGQLVWIVLRERPAVIPAMISEQVMRKTLSGTEINYRLKINIGNKLKTINMEKVNGDFFTDSSDARKYMISNATAAIDAMMKVAIQAADLLDYKGPIAPPETIEKKLDPDKKQIVLENGTVANIKLPEGF